MSSNYFDNKLNPQQQGSNPYISFQDELKFITSEKKIVDFSNPNLPNDIRFAYNKDREPGYFVTQVLDVLSRGQYASAAFTDTLLSQGLTALPSAIYNAASEGISPQARLSYTDLFNRYAPEFSKDNPYTTYTLGLALDIVLDPVTYIGVGLIGKGKKIGGQVVNNLGEQVFKKILSNESKKLALEFGDDVARVFEKRNSALFYRATNENLIANQSAEKIFSTLLSDPTYKTSKLAELGLEEFADKVLTKEKGLRFYFGLGKTEKEIPIYKALDPIFSGLGINRITEKAVGIKNAILESEKIGKYIPSKELLKIDDELKEVLPFYENNLSNINESVLDDVLSIATGVKDKTIDQNKLSMAFLEAGKIKEGFKGVRGFMTIDEQAEVLQSVIKTNNLSANETQLFSSLLQREADINFVETGLDKLIDSIRLFTQSKEANVVVKNADDLIRYKQVLLDGTASSFVASNKELQGKLFSLESLKQDFGKNINVGKKLNKEGKEIDNIVSYGDGIKSLNDDVLSEFAKKEKLSPDFAGSILGGKNSPIISGAAKEKDLSKFVRLLSRKGFIALNPDDAAKFGTIVDDSLTEISQTIFTKEDGSIVRLVKEQINADTYKFDIIKSVKATSKEFNVNNLGKESFDTLTLAQVKNSAKAVDDGVILDPFGVVLQNKKSGDEFTLLYEKAMANGVDINTNAITLYTQRAMVALKEQTKKSFETAAKITYGAEKFEDLPRKLKERLTYLGEGLYKSGVAESTTNLLKFYDNALSFFKIQTTVARPAFAVRQTIQNPIQYALFAGKNPLEIFVNNNPLLKADPRVLTESAMILGMRADNTFNSAVPDFVQNAALSANNKAAAFQTVDILKNKTNVGELDKIIISNPLGQKMTGFELLESAKKLGILKGASSDISTLQRNAEKELSQLLGNSNDKNGVISFFKNNLAYWKAPQQVEDFYRMSYFINGFRSGLDLKESAKMVDKALFNYQTGLTQFETRVMKRIIPFYAFQRNAIPAIITTALTTPGRLATTYKAQEKFFDVWNKLQGGEDLTPYERQISPDFIFEQSSVFAGRNEKGELVYNTFNGLTPLDAINLLEFDPVNGGLNAPATLKKIVLNSVSPYLKMTGELASNRLFFSDRVLTESDRLGNIGMVLDKLPGPVKSMIGYEKTVDPLSGKEKYYISPYIGYVSSSFFPIINDVVRPLDPNKSVSEKVRSILFGSQTYKYNADELSVTNARVKKREIRELKGKVKSAYNAGRESKAEVELKRLENFLRVLDKENSYKNPPQPF